MNDSLVLVRNPKMIASDMDGDKVMIDIDSGLYFGLTGVGPHVWESLERERSVGDVIASVREEFEVGEGDRVEEDVKAFLAALLEKGLVAPAQS